MTANLAALPPSGSGVSVSSLHPFFLLGDVSNEDKGYQAAASTSPPEEDDDKTLVPSKAVSLQNIRLEDDSPLGAWFRNTLIHAYFTEEEEKVFFKEIKQWQYEPLWITGGPYTIAENEKLLERYSDDSCRLYPKDLGNFIKQNRVDLKAGLDRLAIMYSNFHDPADEYVRMVQNRTAAFLATLEMTGLETLKSCIGSEVSTPSGISLWKESYLKMFFLKRPDFDQEETSGFEGALRELTRKIVFPYAGDLLEVKKGLGEIENRLKRSMKELQAQVTELKTRQEGFLKAIRHWWREESAMLLKFNEHKISAADYENYIAERDAGGVFDLPYLFQDRTFTCPLYGFHKQAASFFDASIATLENYYHCLHQTHAYLYKAKKMVVDCLERSERLINAIECEIKKERMANQDFCSLLEV